MAPAAGALEEGRLRQLVLHVGAVPCGTQPRGQGLPRPRRGEKQGDALAMNGENKAAHQCRHTERLQHGPLDAGSGQLPLRKMSLNRTELFPQFRILNSGT